MKNNYSNTDTIVVYRSVYKKEYDEFLTNSLKIKLTDWHYNGYLSEGIGWCYFKEQENLFEVIKQDLLRDGVLKLVISKDLLKRFKSYVGDDYYYRDEEEKTIVKKSLHEISSVLPITKSECISYEFIPSYKF